MGLSEQGFPITITRMRSRVESYKDLLINAQPKDDPAVEHDGKNLEKAFIELDAQRQKEVQYQVELRKADQRFEVYHHIQSRDEHHIKPWEGGLLSGCGPRRI